MQTMKIIYFIIYLIIALNVIGFYSHYDGNIYLQIGIFIIMGIGVIWLVYGIISVFDIFNQSS